ncbi:fucose isomerase [Pelomyxa schiedti]|nr:fucose isomerase [Pelomyxa schiedti]
MAATGERTVYLAVSGDSRVTANRDCWPAQQAMEALLTAALRSRGAVVVRAHPFDERLGHGFIWNQRMGLDVFAKIPRDAFVIVAESVWQYSYFVTGGLRTHQGPILTVANWDATWPGLVGLLNLNASLTKMGKKFSSLWSVSFDDEFFLNGLTTWLKTGVVEHPISHVREPEINTLPSGWVALGTKIGTEMKEKKVIMGIFDEGCMGMYNAFFDDELLNPCGIYKERLSQSALFAAMQTVTVQEAWEAFEWCRREGMTFVLGKDPRTELTVDQVLEQFKMYIAAVRLAHAFSCDCIGIQYQQGLKDTCAASDLAEGLLNNAHRPPVCNPETGAVLFDGEPVVHFNEVDEGSAVDAMVTNRVAKAMSIDPATTLHDIRWGEWFNGDGINDFVWLFEISGAVPPSHLKGGYRGSSSERQPPVFFPRGGGSLKGISKPGEIVWSRVYQLGGALHADLGRGTAVELPLEETQRRWNLSTKQWPVMHAVLHGVTRDQMMARHKSNHIQVVYGNDAQSANQLLAIKLAAFKAMGITPHLCGSV